MNEAYKAIKSQAITNLINKWANIPLDNPETKYTEMLEVNAYDLRTVARAFILLVEKLDKERL